MKHSISFCFLPFISQQRGENSFSLNFSCFSFSSCLLLSLVFLFQVVAHSFQLIHNGSRELKTFFACASFLLFCNTVNVVWWTECLLSSASNDILYHQQQSNKTARAPHLQSLSTTTLMTLMTRRKLKGKTDLHCSFAACALLYTQKIHLFHQLKKNLTDANALFSYHSYCLLF